MVGLRLGCRTKRFHSKEQAQILANESQMACECKFCEGWHIKKRELSNKQIVIFRQVGKCADCFKELWGKLTVHHILPRSNGGGNELSNLVGLCRPCHDQRHNIINTSVRSVINKSRVAWNSLPGKSTVKDKNTAEIRKSMVESWPREEGTFAGKLKAAIGEKVQ